MTHKERPTYTLTLRHESADEGVVTRALRMALKCLLRSFGFVCLECREHKPAVDAKTQEVKP